MCVVRLDKKIYCRDKVVIFGIFSVGFVEFVVCVIILYLSGRGFYN